MSQEARTPEQLLEERNRAQEALRELRERHQAMIEATGQVLYEWNPANNKVAWSGNFESILGYTSQQMDGGLDRWRELVHPEDLRHFDAEAERTKLTGESFRLDYRVRHASGSWLFIHDRGYFVKDAQGNISLMVGLVIDFTRQRMLEEQLRQAQKMEAVGQLAGGVAHDFNNLLTVINGCAELLSARLHADEVGLRLAGDISKAGNRAAALTKQLLAFGRRQILQTIVFGVAAAVMNVERMLRRLIGEDIELVATLAPDLPSVKTDPDQLAQALINLAVNAQDAMPQGGRLTVEGTSVELTADQLATHLEIIPGRYVLLSVADTGHGMDATTRERIFEPFFTTKEVGKGTGLGLAMVYGFVKQSGGHIEVQSQPGQGTTFHLYLPACGGRPTMTGGQGCTRVDTTRCRETILVAEDEPQVRRLIKKILEDAGYTVLDAGSGLEALERCREHLGPIDVLVTDVVMPGMSGRRLSDSLRILRPGIKVLYVSGHHEEALGRHGVLDEGVVVVGKPFTLATFSQKLREVLDAK